MFVRVGRSTFNLAICCSEEIRKRTKIFFISFVCLFFSLSVCQSSLFLLLVFCLGTSLFFSKSFSCLFVSLSMFLCLSVCLFFIVICLFVCLFFIVVGSFSSLFICLFVFSVCLFQCVYLSVCVGVLLIFFFIDEIALLRTVRFRFISKVQFAFSSKNEKCLFCLFADYE